MRTVNVMLLLVGCAIAGCSSTHPDYHVFKCGLTYNKVIDNPYEWTLMQFADGPVSGPEVGDYARGVIACGLEEAAADLNGDGIQDLLIRPGMAGGAWSALCFARVKGGYRYMGDIVASTIVAPQTSAGSILVYEACGGHCGFIKTYKHNGIQFECSASEEIWAGDGYPEENTRRVEELFSVDRCLRWTRVPDVKIGPRVQVVYPSIEEAAIGAWYFNVDAPDVASEEWTSGPVVGFVDHAATVKLWRSKPELLEQEVHDLNSDGVTEVLLYNGRYVTLTGREECSDGGQGANRSWAVLQKTLHGWQVVGAGWGRWPVAQGHTTKGWRDLAGGYHLSAAQGADYLYQFDGTRYKRTQNTEYDQSKGAACLKEVKGIHLDNVCKVGPGVVYALSEDNVLYVGTYEMVDRRDPGRTVVLRMSRDGKPLGRFLFPNGEPVVALYATNTHLFGLCKGEDLNSGPPGFREEAWTLVRMALSGRIEWEKDLPGLARKDVALASSGGEVRIAATGHKDELMICWQGAGDMGTLVFSTTSGKEIAIGDDIRAADGKKYANFGQGLVGSVDKPPLVDVVREADGKWIVDYLNGQLIVQVSRDGKCGRCYLVQDTALKPLGLSAVPFGVRNNGSCFYVADEGRNTVRVFEVVKPK